MRIYHVAGAADWAAARSTGSYTTSTRGRTLQQEGFIHASRREQVPAVFGAFYRDAGEPLVLLTIETERLEAPWREDPVDGDSYPHIYGPLNTSAVVHVEPLNRSGGTESFPLLFAREVFLRVALALGAMLLAVAGSVAGGHLSAEWGGFLGALAGLGMGIVGYVVVLHRRP